MAQNYANNTQDQASLVQALQWYIDHGVDELLLEEPVDRTVVIPDIPKKQTASKSSGSKTNVVGFREQATQANLDAAQSDNMMGAAQAVVEAQNLAQGCQTLEELKQAIMEFEGLSVRKTATNMVFADGNPKASVMLIGEAPGADEDVQGKPFVGISGQLLDRILACIDLDRSSEDPIRSVYISNILNWRTPGNRTPTQAEMDISLPFIERHIALAQPKLLILCGGVAAKTILKRSESISRLRGVFHDYSACGRGCHSRHGDLSPSLFIADSGTEKSSLGGYADVPGKAGKDSHINISL